MARGSLNLQEEEGKIIRGPEDPRRQRLVAALGLNFFAAPHDEKCWEAKSIYQIGNVFLPQYQLTTPFCWAGSRSHRRLKLIWRRRSRWYVKEEEFWLSRCSSTLRDHREDDGIVQRAMMKICRIYYFKILILINLKIQINCVDNDCKI